MTRVEGTNRLGSEYDKSMEEDGKSGEEILRSNIYEFFFLFNRRDSRCLHFRYLEFSRYRQPDIVKTIERACETFSCEKRLPF